jgi:hypothetical protein
MPKLEGCMLCHEDIDEGKPHERTIAAFVGEDGAPKWKRLAALGGDLRFSHKRHTDAEVECSACHGDVAKATSLVESEIRLGKDDCIDCHAKNKVDRDCAVCHERTRADVRPATHGPAWTRTHGEVVHAGLGDEPRFRCSQCHEASSCDSCHLGQQPRDHSALWRRGTHGIAAAFDRERCATCHRSDSCIECHEITRPRSHTAGWGRGPAYRHCSEGCHSGAISPSGAGCTICHVGLPAHADAPALGSAAPPPHPMPMDQTIPCTTCHP